MFLFAAKDSKSLLRKPFLGQGHRSPVTPPFMANNSFRGRSQFPSYTQHSYPSYYNKQPFRGNNRGRPYGTKGKYKLLYLLSTHAINGLM